MRTTKTYNHSDPATATWEVKYTYGLSGPVRVCKSRAGETSSVDYRYEYNELGQVTLFNQSVTANMPGYRHYRIYNIYDLAGNSDTTRLWSIEPTGNTTLVKALDYDAVTEDPGNPLVSSVSELNGNQIVRVTNEMWGGIKSIEYGSNPVLTTTYKYNDLLQPENITTGDLFPLLTPSVLSYPYTKNCFFQYCNCKGLIYWLFQEVME